MIHEEVHGYQVLARLGKEAFSSLDWTIPYPIQLKNPT
jgi:hypothetical protein